MTVRDLQMLSGHSQRQVAGTLGVSAATICNIVNGRLPKNWKTLRPALEAFFVEHSADAQTVRRVLDAIEPKKAKAGKPKAIKTKEQKAMILRRQSLNPATKQHFNIVRNPLRDPEKREDIYTCPQTRYAQAALWDAAKYGNFLALVGESGSGKSTFVAEMETRIMQDKEPVTIIKPEVLALSESDKNGKPLKARDIAEAIILTVQPGTTLPNSNEQMFRRVRQALIEASGRRHLLLIEEAHELNTHTLKTLKRFWEISEGMRRLLSIVLVGQQELETKLSSTAKDVREVVQRCDVVKLPTIPDIADYLRFKFRRNGYDIDAIFDADALGAIQQKLILAQDAKANGTNLAYPLAAANLACAAMNAAASVGESKVTLDIVRDLPVL